MLLTYYVSGFEPISIQQSVSVVFRPFLHAGFCTHYSATLPALQILLMILCMSFLQNMEINTKTLGLALEKAFFSLKESYGVTFNLSCES